MSAIKPIRLGMVGGGRGAFIGEVDRIASRLDNKYCFCGGALSSDPKKSKLSGIELGLDDDRSYGTYEEMIQGESMRDDRIEAVSIAAANQVSPDADYAEMKRKSQSETLTFQLP